MYTVNGSPILEDELSVLEELRRQTISNGLNLFSQFKPSGHNIMTNCPFHKGGQERKPSFGISNKDMSCHCFTCGWSGTLDMMISNIFGYDDNGLFGRRWLAKNFLTVSIQNRVPLELTWSRKREVTIKPKVVITEQELDSYRYTHPYMFERGLTDKIIEEFDVGYDKETNCLTFPVWDINGNPIFIARRSVNYKFFNYPSDAQKPVYGANKVISSDYTEAIICEGILDALTCWKYGKVGLALIGTGTQFQYDILNKLPIRKYIIATDQDEAGNRAAGRLRKYLSDSKILTQYILEPGLDLNDLQEEILNLKEVF